MQLNRCTSLLRLSFTAVVSAALCASAVDQVLIISGKDKDSHDIVRGISDELGGDFLFVEIRYSPRMTGSYVQEIVAAVKPKLAILVDDTAVELFRQYQKQLPDRTQTLPAVVLKGVVLESHIKDLGNATGIFYEVPIVTGTVSLRGLMGRPIGRLGVVYRSYLEEFVRENRVYCEKEKIAIAGWMIPESKVGYASPLRKGLQKLVGRYKVDAVWVPNDAKIFTDRIVYDVWIPFVKKHRIPIIVGNENLVTTPLDFGLFAIRPDNIAYGQQAAELILRIKDNDWNAESVKPELPISVYKVVNCLRAEKLLSLNSRGFQSIDSLTCSPR